MWENPNSIYYTIVNKLLLNGALHKYFTQNWITSTPKDEKFLAFLAPSQEQ